MIENIYTAFKDELGFATASIQYVELACRVAKVEHKEEFSPLTIKDKAQEYGLSVSTLYDDIGIRIAKTTLYKYTRVWKKC